MISPNTQVIGDIKCDGEIQVDGTITGNLEVEHLVIGEHGIIEGNITATQVEVKGTVNGCITAQQVRLEPSARVHGDIVHDTLSIEAGAHIEGQLKHNTDLSNVTPIEQQEQA
nr:polymer-forming cytoskeletal protein [Pseudoalteromonas luteoviolacea]